VDDRAAVEVGDWIHHGGRTRPGWIGRVTSIDGKRGGHFGADWVTPRGIVKRNYPLWRSKLIKVEPTEEELARWMLADLSQ
jgi:hypothetical protein